MGVGHVIIRQAIAEDLDELVPLFDAYRVFYGQKSDHVGARYFLHERIVYNESVVLLLIADRQAVGFVQLYSVFSSVRMQPMWLLNDLFVDSAFRGQGLSRLLIEASKQLARNTEACGLLLETAITNDIANQLYRKTGFVRDEEHHYYFWTNEEIADGDNG
ncbi:MAG: GNAT family N-acetyltransferase [Flavobacteriales bacterium]|nr:GNAT family N-acetyltransferase [Flavobacteriales bacterium]